MIDGGDQKLAPISDAVADMKSGLVNSRRSMMVFRARMQSLEDIIDDIGDAFCQLDRSLQATLDLLAEAARTSQSTVTVCERMLAQAEGASGTDDDRCPSCQTASRVSPG